MTAVETMQEHHAEPWVGMDAGEYVRVRHHVLTGLPVVQAIGLIKAAGFAHLILWSRSDVPAVRERYRVAILADRFGRVAQVGAF